MCRKTHCSVCEVGNLNGANVKAEFYFCFERKTQRVIYQIQMK